MHVTTDTALRIASGSGLSKVLLCSAHSAQVRRAVCKWRRPLCSTPGGRRAHWNCL